MHLCGVEQNEEGTTITVLFYEADCEPSPAINPKLLCNLPAPHENPQYLEESGIFNYVHWLCDGHWDSLLEIRAEEE